MARGSIQTPYSRWKARTDDYRIRGSPRKASPHIRLWRRCVRVLILPLSDIDLDAQVNINWGSKATQFHGSLGKAAAAAASQPQAPIGSSPDDDGRVRISWRGDAAYFAVSTLDAYGVAATHSTQGIRLI